MSRIKKIMTTKANRQLARTLVSGAVQNYGFDPKSNELIFSIRTKSDTFVVEMPLSTVLKGAAFGLNCKTGRKHGRD